MNTDFAHYNEEQLRKLGELHSLLRHSDIGSSYLASLPEPRSVEELNPPQEINVTPAWYPTSTPGGYLPAAAG